MPLAAILPAVIGAGGAIGAGVIGSKAAKSAQKSAQQAALNDPLAIAQREQINQQTAYGKEMADMARRLFPKYEAGTDYLTSYWRSVLDPNNQEALKAIAPIVQARKGQTQALLRGLQFAPRGGGFNAALTDLYSNESRDILNALSGERESARTGYTALTGDIGSRATNLYGSAAGTTANAASLLGSMADRSLSAQFGAAESARNRTSATVTSLADALSPLIYAIIFKQKSGSLGGAGTAAGKVGF